MVDFCSASSTRVNGPSLEGMSELFKLSRNEWDTIGCVALVAGLTTHRRVSHVTVAATRSGTSACGGGCQTWRTRSQDQHGARRFPGHDRG